MKSGECSGQKRKHCGNESCLDKNWVLEGGKVISKNPLHEQYRKVGKGPFLCYTPG